MSFCLSLTGTRPPSNPPSLPAPSFSLPARRNQAIQKEARNHENARGAAKRKRENKRGGELRDGQVLTSTWLPLFPSCRTQTLAESPQPCVASLCRQRACVAKPSSLPSALRRQALPPPAVNRLRAHTHTGEAAALALLSLSLSCARCHSSLSRTHRGYRMLLS